ncbi:MAG: hypothetical protein LBD69_02615 [Puniceicoccales bacterium]|jgi:hypothetical protein|nr:hypothetical protein [Puniceicoccales bacterium]
MPEVSSPTCPNPTDLPPTSSGETSGTGSASSPNPLSGGGVVGSGETNNWLEQLQNAFSQIGEKPVLPNPPDLGVLESYSQVSQETLAHIQRLKDSGIWDGYADLSKLDGDGLALLCMLFTQQSKAELIKGLKKALEAKVNERVATQSEFLADQKKVMEEQIEMQKAAEEQKKAAKAKSIFGILGAIFTAIVAFAITVATFGAAGPVAGALLVGAVMCTIAASATSIASASMTLAAMDNPELAEKYKDHIKNLGIASAVLGIVGCLLSCGAGAAGAGKALDGIAQLVKTFGQVAGALCTVGQGVVQVLQGCDMMELAEVQKNLAAKKIELEKLDSEIEFLQKLIDMLMNSVEEFLDLFLNAEEAAAQEIVRASDSQLAIADEIPRTA